LYVDLLAEMPRSGMESRRTDVSYKKKYIYYLEQIAHICREFQRTLTMLKGEDFRCQQPGEGRGERISQ
jgi:hypothetical protein